MIHKNEWKASFKEKKKLLERGEEQMKKLVLFIEQKIYIKYKNLRDRLCQCVACPFRVEKEVINTS